MAKSMPRLTIDSDDFYEPKEAANALGIGYATLYRWIKDGKLIPFKFRRLTYIPKSEVERLLKKKASK